MKFMLFGILVVFASVLDLFLTKIGINPLSPAYTFVPLFMGIFILRYNPKLYPQYFNTHTLLFLFATLILALVFSLRELPSSLKITLELTNTAISLLLYLFIYILFSRSSTAQLKLFFLVALAVIIVGLLYDTFIGFSLSAGEARKGGFGHNPNITATAVKFLGLCLLLLYRDNKRLRVVFLIMIVLTTFLTFSRSGIFGVVLMAFLLLLNDWKLHFNLGGSAALKAGIKMIFTLSVSYFLLVSFATYLQTQIPELNEGDAGKRIDLLLGKTDKTGGITRDDDKQYGRKNILLSYIDKFAAYPYGYGTGYSADKSLNYKDTHNYYLKMAVNYGFMGLIVALVFFFMCVKRAFKYNNYYYFVFALILMAEGIASHNVFLERPTLIVLAFMDNVLYSLSNNNKQYLTA